MQTGFYFNIFSDIEIMEKAMAPYSSTLAWKILWMEESGRLQSMGSLRVRHDWTTSLSLFTFMHWRRKWQPFQCSCLENPRYRGAWWAAIYGFAQSLTRLQCLSSSSSTRRLYHSQWISSSCFSETSWYYPWSNKCWKFDFCFLCLFETQVVHLEVLNSCTAEA